MEEIEYKLKKKNAILIVDAISKLVDAIKTKGAPHSGKIEELPELKLLKEKCEDTDPIINITACQGVVTLVEVGILGVIPTLSSFIATLPSVRNYTGIVPSIGALLIIDMKARLTEKKSYQCPFSLQSPQHPLVTVLKQKKDVWCDVFSLMEFICSHNEEVVVQNSLELLKPVFLYVLCDPSHPPQLPMACCQQVWILLLKTSFSSNKKHHLLEILSWLQTESEMEVLRIMYIFLELIEVALQNEDTPLCTALAPFTAALIHRLICQGHDPRSCLLALSRLLAVGPEAGSCVLMLFTRTISSCPVIYLKELITFCVSLTEMKICNALATNMLVCALLQWLLYPSYLTGEALQLASTVLAQVECSTSWSSHTNRLCANKYFSHLRNTDSVVGSVVELCRLSETWQSNTATVEDWLNRLSKAPENFNEELHLFVSALFIYNFDQSHIKNGSFQLLMKMVETNKDFAAYTVTLILYKLAKENEPLMQLDFLRGLTKMAVQKENVNLILHTLESLKNRQCSLESLKSKHTVKSLLIDLYLRLWKVECRSYPYLQKLLLETPIDGKDWKFDLARALAIKEICKTRPDQHGSELVKLLSQILNQCGSNEGATSSALALQGITALCNAEVVNISTTWRALAPKLCRDKRPVVIKSLCDFFGCILSMNCSGQDYDKLVADVVSRLWIYVSTSKDPEVVSAALKALSKADLEKLSLKSLPECYRQRLQLPTSYAKTPVDAARKPEDVLPYIPCECWIQLLQNMNSETIDAAGDTLSQWLSVELTLYTSAIYRTPAARGEPGSYSFLHHRSICRGITDHLLRLSRDTLETSKIVVAKQCLRILSHSFPRPLPPLNWSFLQEFLKESELQRYCLIIALKQAATSGSARKLIENNLNSFMPSTETEETVRNLFEHLTDLCKGVPPNILKPFIEKSFVMALDISTNEDKNGVLLTELLSQVKATLKRDDIHDANRVMLSIMIEGLLEKFDASHKFFDAYVDCVTELTSKYLERMSSPSVWWEVTADKLRQSLGIRSALARKADTEVPLVWLNECIDASLGLVGEHTNILQNIASVVSCIRNHATNCRWTMELLGKIQNVVNNQTDSSKQQALVFLCDIFVIAVIILSGHDCLAPSLDSIASSRELRLMLFPQALTTLLAREQWKSVASQVMEWLYHMQKLNAISPLYADTFCHGLMALRHDKYFKIGSVWTRFISSSPVKLQ